MLGGTLIGIGVLLLPMFGVISSGSRKSESDSVYSALVIFFGGLFDGFLSFGGLIVDGTGVCRISSILSSFCDVILSDNRFEGVDIFNFARAPPPVVIDDFFPWEVRNEIC